MIDFSTPKKQRMISYQTAILWLGVVWMIAVPLAGAWGAVKFAWIGDVIHSDVLAAICLIGIAIGSGLVLGTAVALVFGFGLAMGQAFGFVEENPEDVKRMEPGSYKGGEDLDGKWKRN